MLRQREGQWLLLFALLAALSFISWQNFRSELSSGSGTQSTEVSRLEDIIARQHGTIEKMLELTRIERLQSPREASPLPPQPQAPPASHPRPVEYASAEARATLPVATAAEDPPLPQQPSPRVVPHASYSGPPPAHSHAKGWGPAVVAHTLEYTIRACRKQKDVLREVPLRPRGCTACLPALAP